MSNALLYPRESRTRRVVDISGMWNFQIDYDSKGRAQSFKDGLPDPTTVPVPSSWNDFFTDRRSLYHTGDVWYETSFYLPLEWQEMDVNIRFGCATHSAVVYLNGHEVATHVGGFTPFNAPANAHGVFGGENHLVVVVNNELSPSTLPSGETTTLANGAKLAKPNFDFFNYSGLHRPVKITAVPKCHVDDVSLVTTIEGQDGIVEFDIETTGDHGSVEVELFDKANVKVGSSVGKHGKLVVKNAQFWYPGAPYLYKLRVSIRDGEKLVDEYSLDCGIRTVKVEGTKFLINGKPFYFKGFGKHEDAAISGRGFNQCVMKRDFELMKWINANSFRTSHYPYAEEYLEMADREGFVVIDECAAVGMLNMQAMMTGAKSAPFFDGEYIKETMKVHKEALKELFKRDKNHPCVCMWSLMNEPDAGSESADHYFKELFEFARTLDPQKRPLTFVCYQMTGPTSPHCLSYPDVYCLNRYFAWYFQNGPEFDTGIALLTKELQGWQMRGKPIVLTEFGADTMAGIHKLPATMWSEEYQQEFLEAYFKTFDSVPAVCGEQMWNFADFQTADGVIRVDGNKKGLFTRDRQPKMAAYTVQKRWKSIPNDFTK